MLISANHILGEKNIFILPIDVAERHYVDVGGDDDDDDDDCGDGYCDDLIEDDELRCFDLVQED